MQRRPSTGDQVPWRFGPSVRRLRWRGTRGCHALGVSCLPGNWQLDGVQRVYPEPDQPLALLAGTPQRRVLQTVNDAARALGLRPGLH